MEHLPGAIEQHRPNPLGRDVEAANPNGARHIHCVADQLAVMSAPKSDLPAVLKEAREQMERAEQLQKDAQDKIDAGVSAWRFYQAALLAAGELRKDIAAGDTMLARCQRDIETIQADFDLWPKNLRENKWAYTCDRVASVLAAREMLKLFPASLKPLRAKLHKAEADIAEMEKKNGFSPEAPARPVSQWPQPEAEQAPDAPGAFRGEQ
jgi:hypothetical protein